ncbi:MAG: serine/threonine-protein kinase [Deltaproteobacteria bacterium]
MSERPDTAARQFGRYELLKAIGHGQMSTAYLARSTEPEPIVVKLLHPHHEIAPDFVQRFRHEAAVARYIDSDNVTRVHDFGLIDGTSYIACEYIPGWSVAAVLSDLKKKSTPLSVEAATNVAVGLLNGLEAIHEARVPSGEGLQLVHRDVSPNNVMIREDGVIKVIDLGLGRSVLQDWKTKTGLVIGSVGYMAPEQVMGRSISSAVDIYAAGAIVYETFTLDPHIRRGLPAEMLFATANPRFRPPSRLRSELPGALDDVLEIALRPEPRERFASARAFREALTDALGPPTRAIETKTVVSPLLWKDHEATEGEIDRLVGRRPRRRPRRARRAEVMAMVGAVSVAALGVGLALRPSREVEAPAPAPAERERPTVVPIARPDVPATEPPATEPPATEPTAPPPARAATRERAVAPAPVAPPEAPPPPSSPAARLRRIEARLLAMDAQVAAPFLAELELIRALDLSNDPARAHRRLDDVERRLPARPR